MIYESQLRHLISWGKVCITFGTFYDQLWAATTRDHKILFLTSAYWNGG